jgi:hypothetical protein
MKPSGMRLPATDCWPTQATICEVLMKVRVRVRVRVRARVRARARVRVRVRVRVKVRVRVRVGVHLRDVDEGALGAAPG